MTEDQVRRLRWLARGIASPPRDELLRSDVAALLSAYDERGQENERLLRRKANQPKVEAELERWLEANAMRFSVVAWGPDHTKLAAEFAEWWATAVVRRTLDEALNAGDGSYRP